MRKLMVAVALAVLAGLAGAQAQTFPSRPITLVVALPAGGAGIRSPASWPST